MATHFVAMSYGPRLAERFQATLVNYRDWHLQPVHLLVVVDEIIQKLRELNISWYLGGSVASSLYGMQQLAQDIDLVVDLLPQKTASFEASIASLKPHFAFEEQAVHQALLQHTAIALLHMDTAMKVDLIIGKHEMSFLSRDNELCTMELDENHQEVPVASVYEMILFKLYRYHLNELSRQDGMTDDMQWNDILGMLKVQGPALDLSLLEQEVKHLSLEHIWDLVLIDAGLRKG
ncbi:hypothetical protein KSZ_71800 [Dictyobacter formicarum]|uniref:Nucleotidyltransferase n=1 Tax=Dictyobacter formicarum TaxID=2778368 RepID=A0ABQ3VSB4_9CHLR|nr:hypothetical protein KSZ_71800 [Dictyobacter formicarum]